jgi:hypothetical protein
MGDRTSVTIDRTPSEAIMKNLMRLTSILALAALAMVSAARTGSAAMRWGGEVNGSFNTHSMKDWNDIIDQANASGASFDNIKSGYSFGVGPTVVVNDRWQFGAQYEMLMAKKSSFGGVDIENKANAFGASGEYLFPSKSMMSFGLGVGVDYYTLTGDLKQASPPTTDDTKGTGVGGKIFGTGSYAFAPEFSGILTVGYRLANIDIDTIGGQDVSSQGLKTEDYSGVIIRAGISLHQAAK